MDWKTAFFAEFRRHIWLEFSKQKIALLALSLILIYGINSTISNAVDSTSVTIYFLYVSLGAATLWGVTRAVDSLTTEMQNNTWDFQRLSGLPPSSLIFGKLLGAPSFIFLACFSLYCVGLTIMLVHVDALPPSPTLNDPWARSFHGYSTADVTTYLYQGYIGAACVLMSMLTGMASALQLYSHTTKRKRFTNTAIKAIAILIGGAFYFTIVNLSPQNTIEWYGYNIVERDFGMGILGLAVIWALIAVYQSLRKELQFLTTPWAWIVVGLNISLLFLGFKPDSLAFGTEFGTATFFVFISLCLFGTFLTLSCIVALTEDLSPVRYKKSFSFLTHKKHYISWALIPRWAPLMAIAIIAMLGCLALILLYAPKAVTATYVLAMFLFFTLRDILILHILTFKNSDKSPYFIFIIYLAILYWALPAFFRVLGAGESLDELFYPNVDLKDVSFVNVLPSLIQALIAGIILMRPIIKKREARALVDKSKSSLYGE